jgi:hypothetical protein
MVEGGRDTSFGIGHVHHLAVTITGFLPGHVLRGRDVVPRRQELPDKIGPALAHTPTMFGLVRKDRLKEHEVRLLRERSPARTRLWHRVHRVGDDGDPSVNVAAAISRATTYPTGPTGRRDRPQRTTAVLIASIRR